MPLTPSHDITWETVTFHPPYHAQAGKVYENLMSCDGRVLMVVGPDNAMLYRRRADGDFELAATVDLGDAPKGVIG